MNLPLPNSDKDQLSLLSSFSKLDITRVDPKNMLFAKVTKARSSNDSDLRVIENDRGIFVSRVEGAFHMFTEIRVGDQLLKLQDKDVDDMKLEEVNRILIQDKTIEIHVVHPTILDPDASATSVTTEDLDIQPGDILRLNDFGDTALSDLNDIPCLVKRESTKAGRWLIEIPGGEKMIVDERKFVFPDTDEEIQELIEEWKHTMSSSQ